MAELSRAESWNWIYTEASVLLQKIQSLYENGAEAVTQGKIEYETKPIRRGITASPDFRVSKKPPTVKKQDKAMAFDKAFPSRGRWQKSLIFDG